MSSNQQQQNSYGSQRADYSHGFRRPVQPSQSDVEKQAAEAAMRLATPQQTQPSQPVTPPVQPSQAEQIAVRVEPQQQLQSANTATQPAIPPQEPQTKPVQPSQPQYIQHPGHKQADDHTLPTDLNVYSSARKDSFSSAKPKKQNKFKLGVPKLPSLKAVGATAAAVFLVGAGVYTYAYLSGSGPELANVQGASDTKDIQDDEGGLLPGVRPHEGGNVPSVEYYRTSPSFPRVLRVPKIEIETRILPLSISATGALKSPATIFDTAWYKDSAKPGEDGAMVINAHTAGEYNKGIFYNLESLKKGDLIEIEDGAGNTYVYTVKDVREYEADQVNMSSVMRPFGQSKKGLNLINAAGRVVGPDTFEKRIVVYSVIEE